MWGELVSKTGNSSICADMRNSVTTRINIGENQSTGNRQQATV